MKNETDDPHWKELAEHLRKLNVDYYWRIRNRISEEIASGIGPPSRPVRTSGMGISLSLRQEHTPPLLPEDRDLDNAVKLPGVDRESDPSKGGRR